MYYPIAKLWWWNNFRTVQATPTFIVEICCNIDSNYFCCNIGFYIYIYAVLLNVLVPFSLQKHSSVSNGHSDLPLQYSLLVSQLHSSESNKMIMLILILMIMLYFFCPTPEDLQVSNTFILGKQLNRATTTYFGSSEGIGGEISKN